MMEPVKKITIDTAENYKWGDNCDGWHLLKTDSLGVIRERMGPHTSEQLHFHNKAQQLFCILTGEAGFEIDGEVIMLKAGESVHIPPNTVHKIFNNTDGELHFIVISEPKSHGDRVNV